MGFAKDIIGLALISAAWANPLGLDLIARALLFVLGFEIMSMFVKVGVLALSVFFYQTFGLLFSLILAGMFGLELLLSFVISGLIFGIILRPVVLFAASFLISHAPLPSALIGLADFALIFLGTRLKL